MHLGEKPLVVFHSFFYSQVDPMTSREELKQFRFPIVFDHPTELQNNFLVRDVLIEMFSLGVQRQHSKALKDNHTDMDYSYVFPFSSSGVNPICFFSSGLCH